MKKNICIVGMLICLLFLTGCIRSGGESHLYTITLLEGEEYTLPETNITIELLDATSGIFCDDHTMTSRVYLDGDVVGTYITTRCISDCDFRCLGYRFIHRSSTNSAGSYKIVTNER